MCSDAVMHHCVATHTLPLPPPHRYRRSRDQLADELRQQLRLELLGGGALPLGAAHFSCVAHEAVALYLAVYSYEAEQLGRRQQGQQGVALDRPLTVLEAAAACEGLKVDLVWKVAYDVLAWAKATQRACEAMNDAAGGAARAAVAFPRACCRYEAMIARMRDA